MVISGEIPSNAKDTPNQIMNIIFLVSSNSFWASLVSGWPKKSSIPPKSNERFSQDSKNYLNHKYLGTPSSHQCFYFFDSTNF